jgi:hypothetical protein
MAGNDLDMTAFQITVISLRTVDTAGEADTAHKNKFLDAGVFSCYPLLAAGTKTCLSCEVSLW